VASLLSGTQLWREVIPQREKREVDDTWAWLRVLHIIQRQVFSSSQHPICVTVIWLTNSLVHSVPRYLDPTYQHTKSVVCIVTNFPVIHSLLLLRHAVVVGSTLSRTFLRKTYKFNAANKKNLQLETIQIQFRPSLIHPSKLISIGFIIIASLHLLLVFLSCHFQCDLPNIIVHAFLLSPTVLHSQPIITY
jgi:hypothetical protein